MEYLSAVQIAEKWNLSVQRVRVLLRENRVPGTIKIGKSFLVPASSEKPEDPRRLRRRQSKGYSENNGKASDCYDFNIIKQCYEDTPELFYLITPENHHIIYANSTVRNIIGDANGQCCYKVLRGRSTPCSDCPKKSGSKNIYLDAAGKYFSIYGRAVSVNGKEFFGVTGLDFTGEASAKSQVENEKRRYNDLYNTIPSGLAVFEKNGNDISLIEINRFLRELEEIPDERVLDLSFENHIRFIYPDDRKSLKNAVTEAFENNTTTSVEFRLWSRRDRKYVFLRADIRSDLLRSEVKYAYACVTDVEIQQKILCELEESKKQLEEAETHSDTHYIDYDNRTGITVLGKQILREFELSDTTLQDFPKSILRPDILFPDDYELYEKNFENVKQGKAKEVYFNARFMNRRSEKYTWRKVHFIGTYDTSGVLERISGTSQDVDRYLKLEQTYMAAMAQNEIVTWEYDTDTCSGTLYLGFESSRHFTQDTIFTYSKIHPDYISAVKDFEKKTRAGICGEKLDIQVLSQDGDSYIWCRISATVLGDSGRNDFHRFLITSRDITSLKNSEKQYETEKEFQKAAMSSLISYSCVNLTKGTVEEMQVFDEGIILPDYRNIVDYYKRVSLVMDDVRLTFQDNVDFSVDKLKEGFANGKTSLSKTFFAKKKNSNLYIGVRVVVKILRRPSTKDLVAFFYCRDISYTLMSNASAKIINSQDFDCTGYIVLPNRHVYFTASSVKAFEASPSCIQYEEVYSYYRNRLLCEKKDSDLGCDAFLEKMKQSLDKNDVFLTTILMNGDNGSLLKKRARFKYFSLSHDFIAFSISDITDSEI